MQDSLIYSNTYYKLKYMSKYIEPWVGILFITRILFGFIYISKAIYSSYQEVNDNHVMSYMIYDVPLYHDNPNL